MFVSFSVSYYLSCSELTGNTVVGFTEEELEGEFDPCSYDASMSRIFDEGYYEEEQEGAEKPVFSDSEEEG